MRKKIALCSILVAGLLNTGSVFAQTSEMQKQMEEIMKTREEMFRMLLDDSSTEAFDKRFEDMVKRFQQGGGFGGLGLEQFDDPIVGEYDWIKTNTHKILKLKVKQVKDKPLDIKIENGMIRLKGDVETVDGDVRRKVSFQRAFTLPDDVDQTNPEFENKDGSMLIKFKYKHLSKTKKGESPEKTEPPKDDRVPLSPDKDGISI